MKISVQTAPILDRLGADECFRLLKETGFDGVDYNLDHIITWDQLSRGETIPELEQGIEAWYEYARPVRDAAQKYGIEISQIHTPFPCYTENEKGNELAMECNKRSFAVAKWLGCRCCIVHPHFLGYEHRLSREEERRINLERYTELIPAARENDVIICLENMFVSYRGKIYGAICSDMAEANRYIDTLNEIAGERRFGFCLDIGHAVLAGRELYDTIVRIGPNLTALHVHDNDGKDDLHLFPGMGVADWDSFTRGLKDAGYRGVLSFETYNALQSRFDRDVWPEALRLLNAQGRTFARRIEG